MTNEVFEREPIGLKDVNGNDIHLGDLVEFFGCPVHGPSAVKTPCAARMVDIVTRLDEKTPIPGHFTRTYFFINWLGDGAFAHRYAKFCRIIGSIPKDAHMFVDQIPPFMMQVQGGREALLKSAKEIRLAAEAK